MRIVGFVILGIVAAMFFCVLIDIARNINSSNDKGSLILFAILLFLLLAGTVLSSLDVRFKFMRGVGFLMIFLVVIFFFNLFCESNTGTGYGLSGSDGIVAIIIAVAIVLGVVFVKIGTNERAEITQNKTPIIFEDKIPNMMGRGS